MSCHHCHRRRHFQRPTFQKCNRHFRMVKEAITIYIVCHLINVLCWHAFAMFHLFYHNLFQFIVKYDVSKSKAR